ncbi:hypothetical protein [Paenibacillus sp. Root444D2]|uniref:hypothetical protein n=1 Tax=Paenibacillus sp. Root444D2 TaxID=1736538 RepID=UPI000709A24D|nr:hypothetical protein [Paenibacillus sp. Root444D2]KQX68235.1 hypothetical protein ASD40_25530 [Paenibacillus sp. Root444D2]
MGCKKPADGKIYIVLEEIQLVFNSELDLKHSDDPIGPLIKDYAITLIIGDGTEREIKISGNSSH